MENRADPWAMQRAVSALSHDMRAPIQNMIALAQMSLRCLSGGDPSVASHLENILVAAHDLQRMTEGVLGGALQGMRGGFTARELSSSLRACVGAQAALRQQTLTIDLAALGDAPLPLERTALERILTNLLSNAVKYTPPGGEIRLSARPAENESALEFTVRDNGMGMDEAFLNRMYEPLARAQEALAQQIPGSGLGLAIVQRMTQRLGGTISVKSAPGRGTAFTLRVPLPPLPALAGKRILLAEDNDLSAQIAMELLSREGALASRAADGLDALNVFRRSPPGTFDAVLMDMHMPRLDGAGAALAIRALPRPDAGDIAILALTAGGADDARLAINSGMDACLQKPLDAALVREALARGKNRAPAF